MKKITLLVFMISLAAKVFAIDGLLIKTIDYSFKEKWNNTIGSSIPVISICEKVFKKQYFFITAIAGDYELDYENCAKVDYSVKIFRPDNSVYFSKDKLSLIDRKIGNRNNLQMSDAILKVCFENNDEPGTYKFEMQIIDNISGKIKIINSEINLVELPSVEEFKIKNDKEFMKWIEKYYANPSPETAIANYIYYSKSKLSDNESSFPTILSMFIEIIRNNQFLRNQIDACYNSQDDKTKIYLIYLLHYSQIEAKDFFDGLNAEGSETYAQIKDNPLPDIYGLIYDPSQLDMLWATFLAGGSYQPILKLIQTLDYSQFQGDLDRFKTSNQSDEDRQKAINNAIFNSLVWSLGSNCKQHELVFEYCNWAYQYENLTDIQKSELGKILNNLK